MNAQQIALVGEALDQLGGPCREVIELASRAHKLSRPQSGEDFHDFLSSTDEPILQQSLIPSVGATTPSRSEE
jgi:hypothetical protein